MRRSGKIQLLFHIFIFAVFLYLWIVMIALQTFILPENPPIEFPKERVGMIFILYGILSVSALAGTVLSIFIGNRRYTRLFGALVIIIFATIVAAKSISG